MEIANLRLKFTPTLKDIEHSSTKCCLEIVPEVSYVNNIDKIQWKTDSDSIIYVVPMTYKIILKKKRSEEIDTTLDKTYHSCVDLLPPSSLSNINFASGDVNRFISDTFIVSTVTANFGNDEKKEETVNMHVYDSNTNQTNECVTIRENVSFKIDEESKDEGISVSSKDEDQDNVNPSAEVITIKFEDDEVESKSEVAEHIEPQKIELSNQISSSTKEVISKRKLSITPICSVDTTDSITKVQETKSLNMFTFENVCFKLFNNEKLNNPINLKSKRQNSPTRSVYLHKPISSIDIVPSFCFSEDRERPEIKVANFVKKMESEIMPLKAMLNDILRKCSKLGLMNKMNKPVSPVPRVIHKVPKNINVTNVCWREEQPKSNRVVYSIVFDT